MTIAAPRKPRSTLDRALYSAMTLGWGADRLTSYEQALRQHDDAMPDELSRIFASIDAKATGLLTHTSMMIAGLGLVAPLVASNKFEIGVVVAEMGIYLLIALGCLRCLSVFRTHAFGAPIEDTKEQIHHELVIRRELYSLCIRSAIVFTVIVFVLLPVLFFWTPERLP